MSRRRLRRKAGGVHTPPPQLGFAWQNLAIEGGGFVTGVDTAVDGTVVVRCDTYGGYEWDGAQWQQLMTIDTMPLTEFGIGVDGEIRGGGAMGIYEISIAPSNSAVKYMMWNGVPWRRNGTERWVKLDDWTTTAFSPNDPSFRVFGPHMDISPDDEDHVIAGAPTFIGRTTDGGANWVEVSDVLLPTTDAGVLVRFDPSNGLNVFIGSNGRGVYRSTNGGATFTLLASGPTTMRRMDVGADGVLMVVADGGTTTELWRWNGSWTNFSISSFDVTSGSSIWHSVCPNPAVSGAWYIGNEGGGLRYTANNGTSFTAFFHGTRTATDVPWLENTNELYMSNGDMAMRNGKLYFAQGIGVWTVNSPPTSAASFNWVSQTKGICQMVTTRIISPPSGNPIFGFWDRPFFVSTDPDTNPSNHGLNYNQSVTAGWSVSYAASNPTFIWGITSWFGGLFGIGVSDNGGQTWEMVTSPSGMTLGGSISAGTEDDAILVGSGSDARVKVTHDRGQIWANVTATGLPTSGETGFGSFSTLHRHVSCFDKVDPTVAFFYANGTSGSAASAGLWRSTDSGDVFTRVMTGRMPVEASNLYNLNNFNAKMDTVPSNTGHIFYTAGDVGYGGVGAETVGDFLRCTNGLAATPVFTAIPNVKEVKAFGFGAASPSGSGYPALFIAGWYFGEWGIWQSDNADLPTPTFAKIGDFPLGWADFITAVSGDMNTYGVCYVGRQGSSIAVYREVVL